MSVAFLLIFLKKRFYVNLVTQNLSWHHNDIEILHAVKTIYWFVESMVHGHTSLVFLNPFHYNFNDVIKVFHVVIGFKHDCTMDCRIRGIDLGAVQYWYVTWLHYALHDLTELRSPFIIHFYMHVHVITLIARFMGPTWGPSGANRTQVVPMLAPWTLLSG